MMESFWITHAIDQKNSFPCLSMQAAPALTVTDLFLGLCISTRSMMSPCWC